MKIVIAPDSFKESLSAMAVAEAIEKGFREIYPDADYVKVPMADGGEGTVQSMVEASGGRYVDHGNVLTTKVDGVNYRQAVGYRLSCNGRVSDYLKLQIQGNAVTI
ncbi:glycerate kinase, partial [Salmonella enterica subsp. enterica serovar Cerro]|nr:glycerate kinase [Salmonella enterica subsp. enterica serovar Cerro]